MKQIGRYAVLTTDVGLTVKYDWNTRLYISVPSSYYRHLGGLCGNYNGDRKDDLPSSDGKETRSKKNYFLLLITLIIVYLSKYKHMKNTLTSI